MSDEEPPQHDPEAQADPGTAVSATVAPAGGERPGWTYFPMPAAVIIGALVIAGAIWWTPDNGAGAPAPAVATVEEDAASNLPAPAMGLLATFNGYAKQVGANPAAFEACLSKPETARLINDHFARGAALGVNGTPTFIINNKLIVGDQPAAVFDEVIAAELKGSPTAVHGYSQAVQQLAASGRFKILTAPVDLNGAAIEGDPGARVVIAEFSDFQCPFCKRWVDTNIGRLRQTLGRDVALAFLHFPITQIHPNAGNASAAAICAGEQGKFWEMHDLLFARQAEWQALK